MSEPMEFLYVFCDDHAHQAAEIVNADADKIQATRERLGDEPLLERCMGCERFPR